MADEREVTIGSRWKHRKKQRVYSVTQVNEAKNEVYLQAETAGARSTWKYRPLVPFDYERID